MRKIYNISIYIYYLIILIASFFNNKASLWLKGRKGIYRKLNDAITPGENIVWFHCSSLGEFEQGRPLIEAYKLKFPQHKILLTFFSPSGYEIRKNFKGADYIFYLPLDTESNAKRFLKIVKPQNAFFIKYEYWYNYLNQLYRQNIPVYMVSAIYRPNQHFFKWYGSWFRKHLKNMKHIFVQNEESEKLLKSIGAEQVTISGDTRFDRVNTISGENKSFPVIESFINGFNIFIAGSTWQKDEEIINEMFNVEGLMLNKKYSAFNTQNLKFIIAPHIIDIAHINEIRNLFDNKNSIVLLSEATLENVLNKKILIIDSIGILSYIYKYSTIAYIGGGFGSGIHNILEAAVYGKPLIFGTNYLKFQEAKDLIGLGGAFSVKNSEELINLAVTLIKNGTYKVKVSEITKNYVKARIGATNRILKQIENN